MKLYVFDPDTFKFVGEKDAELDELQTEIAGRNIYKGEANSTFVEPPSKEGYTAYYMRGAWELIANPTEEELAEQALAQAKVERAKAVSSITVEVDDMIFDGDELAQGRMARAITMSTAAGLPADSTTPWVLADSTIADVTVAQLSKALLLAGEKQTELWLKPYTNN